MPCPLVGRTKLSHRIRYFFIRSFVATHVTCSNSEWGYRGFLWTKGTPKYISRNRAALVNISREQGNKPNFGGSECGNLENSSVSMHWPYIYAFVIVRRQSQYFDALLIFKRMLMSENWLKQDVWILQFMHQIFGTFCVPRYQQFCTLMVNGNAYNQNLLIVVTHWVEKTDLIRSAVWSYSTVHAEKVQLALATPLWKQLSHFIAETLLFQLPVIIASNFTCSKVILSGDFYRGNPADPPARVKPPWDAKI